MSGAATIWLSLALTSTGTERLLARVVAGHEALPALAEVQGWAVEAAGLASAAEAQSWAARARWRGLVPRLVGRLGSDANLYVRDTLGDWTPTTTDRRALALRIEARLELGELVFADLELRASREAIARSAAERLLLEEVTRLYFERVELWLRRCRGLDEAGALRAATLDGLLRAYTGGRYAPRPARGGER